MRTFEITDEQLIAIARWRGEQDEIALEQQRKGDAEGVPFGGAFARAMREGDESRPYYGLIGGSISYIFTPTSVGIFLVVKHVWTGAELELNENFG